MSEKSQTITLPLSIADCYELVKRLGNDAGFEEKKSDQDGIVWAAKNFTLQTWVTPIAENKTKVEIIASSGALFDGATLEKSVKIFAKRLKIRGGSVHPVKIKTPSPTALTPAKLPDMTEESVIPETKKCPYCAETVRYEAIVCRYCGRDLTPSPTSVVEAKSQTIEVKTRKPKSPAAAILLNAFPLIFGLGYIYIGKWSRFLIVFGIQIFSLIPMTMLGLREYNVYLLALAWIASMIDVHSQVKTYNEQITT